MPRSYASQFRAMVVEQVRSGRRVAEVAATVDVPEGTLYRWVRQERIDRGELAGTSTSETAELRAARRRIAELESELAIVKRASALFDKGTVVRPKALFGIVETLARGGITESCGSPICLWARRTFLLDHSRRGPGVQPRRGRNANVEGSCCGVDARGAAFGDR